MVKARRKKPEIAYAKIFPSIGIARVGDSEEKFFYGPEFSPEVSPNTADRCYRDASGKIKRQAARFRIYGFNDEGRVVREITAREAAITWTVHVANKKAAWFEFKGTQKARQQFSALGSPDVYERRNAKIGKIILNNETQRFTSDLDRSVLEIDGGMRSIEGVNQEPEPGERGDRYRFKGYFKRGLGGYTGHEIYLGELRTDDDGRLVFLGGRGASEPVGLDGPARGADRLNYWIVNYANNDHWHDDTADGPVTAHVALKDGTEIRVDNGAWVVVAPPDFAPDVTNIVTLYDAMEEVAIAARLKTESGCPPLRGPQSVSVDRDIAPILQRMNDYRWTSPLGLRGHGYAKPGAAGPGVIDQFTGISDAAKHARERFFNVLRVPTYSGLDPLTGREAEVDKSLASAQANSYFMPPLSGDEGDRTPGNPKTWLSLTRLQYARMERWTKGAIEQGTTVVPEDDGLQAEPARLTRCALEACAGGAFFPGIEMTAIVRDPSLYGEPFRIDHSRVGPGDITKYMACPWQADFYECRDAWWPAQRPDTVITDLTFDELLKSFKEDQKSNFEAVTFERERWDRGLERKPRPSREWLLNRLLPEPESADAGTYAKAVAATAVNLLFGLSPAAAYRKHANKPLAPGVEAERLSNPWRLQYVTQEQLDGYAGRYFLPAIPSPEQAIGDLHIPDKFGPAPDFPNLAEIRRNWGTVRIICPAAAGYMVGTYAKKMEEALQNYLTDLILSAPSPGYGGQTPAQQLRYNLINAPSDPLSDPSDFGEDSDAYKRLRTGEFVNQLVSSLFLIHSERGPDMAIVDGWRNL